MYLPTTDSRHVCNASQVLGKFFFFVLSFSLTTGCYSTPQAQDTSQTCLKYMVSFFFLLFVFLYTYNFTYYSVNTDSRRVLSPTTTLMAWTGRERGREEGRRWKRWGQWATEGSRCICVSSPQYFFFISLFISTYTYLQITTTTENSHHVTHCPLTAHWPPTTNNQPPPLTTPSATERYRDNHHHPASLPLR